MIFGIGIDTVSISRVKRLMERYGEHFLRKVYTDEEIAEGRKRKDSAPFFAARFAAREAFLKALGTGLRGGLSLKEIGIVTTEEGQPLFRLTGRAEEALDSRSINKCHLSITHEGDAAQAVAILEKI